MNKMFEPEFQVFYNRHADTLLVELAPEHLASHIVRTGPVVVHASSTGRPVLLEIEGASKFLSSVIQASLRD